MTCKLPFCQLMYAGHMESQRKMKELEVERNMYRDNYTRTYSELTTIGNENRRGQHVLPNGEIMKAETYIERTRMFNENRNALERRNKELDEARKNVEQLREAVRVKSLKVRELEDKLGGFDRPRDFVFSNDRHKETVTENDALKVKNQTLEEKNRRMKDDIKTLQKSVGQASKATVLIPKRCPYGGCSRDSYVRGVLISKDAGQALKNHIFNFHWCPHCKAYLNDTTTAKHIDSCEKNVLRTRVPKRTLAVFQQDDLESATPEERAAIEAEMAAGEFDTPTFVVPTTTDGTVDLAVKFTGLHCRFCFKGPYTDQDQRAEHEDVCADVKLYRRFRCPCFGYSDREVRKFQYFFQCVPDIHFGCRSSTSATTGPLTSDGPFPMRGGRTGGG